MILVATILESTDLDYLSVFKLCFDKLLSKFNELFHWNYKHIFSYFKCAMLCHMIITWLYVGLSCLFIL